MNDPLGLALAIDGDVLTTNGNDGYLLETTRKGKQEFKILLDDTGDPPGAGALFGLAVVPSSPWRKWRVFCKADDVADTRSHEALGNGRGGPASARPILVYPTPEE